MKSISIILGILLCASMPIFSQNISCTELIDHVESEGMPKGSISSMILYVSSWLGEVKAYTIEGNVAGVAKIKKNELSPLLILKYNAIADANKELGDFPSIRNAFIGFQQHLYGQAVNSDIN